MGQTQSRSSAAFAMNGRSLRVSEKLSSIEALLRRHRRVAVDSNVLIYLLEGTGPLAEVAARLVDSIGRGEVEGVLASIGLAEILVPAAKADDGPAFERTAATIRDLGFRIIALDARVAEDAAWVRGRTSVTMPDAIHLACARQSGATVFVTNDRRVPVLTNLGVAVLEDLAP
jgi:predicted nucleic acid-binding protein